MATPTPHLVLFSGLPGTGKSSLSYYLAREMAWPLLSKDQFDRVLEQCAVRDHLPTLAYELLFGAAQLTLRQGVSTILDAVFPLPGFRERARTLAEAEQARFLAVVCWCSDHELWRRRVESRPEMVEGWTPAGWAEVQRVEGYYQAWTEPHLRLDAAAPFADNCRRLREAVAALRG